MPPRARGEQQARGRRAGPAARPPRPCPAEIRAEQHPRVHGEHPPGDLGRGPGGRGSSGSPRPRSRWPGRQPRRRPRPATASRASPPGPRPTPVRTVPASAARHQPARRSRPPASVPATMPAVHAGHQQRVAGRPGPAARCSANDHLGHDGHVRERHHDPDDQNQQARVDVGTQVAQPALSWRPMLGVPRHASPGPGPGGATGAGPAAAPAGRPRPGRTGPRPAAGPGPVPPDRGQQPGQQRAEREPDPGGRLQVAVGPDHPVPPASRGTIAPRPGCSTAAHRPKPVGQHRGSPPVPVSRSGPARPRLRRRPRRPAPAGPGAGRAAARPPAPAR